MKRLLKLFAATLLFFLVSSLALADHPATVRVSVPLGGNQSGLGSGVLAGVDADYGYVLTAYHVVRDARGKPSIAFADGTKSNGDVFRQDQTSDLACIRVARPKIEPVEWASEVAGYGKSLTAAGYGGDGRYHTSSGAVVGFTGPPGTSDRRWVIFNAVVRPGDSGGPIFNENGQLAGIIWGVQEDGQSRPIGPSYGSHLGSLVRLAQCQNGYCFPIRKPGNPPTAPPRNTPPVVQQPPAPLTPVAEFDKRLSSLEAIAAKAVPAIESLDKRITAIEKRPGVPGPIGPQGEKGDPGDCKCDKDAIAADAAARLLKQPIRVEILDEHGKVSYRQDVYVGGEPLQLQLVPRQK